MIRTVSVAFGLVAFGLVVIVGGWLILALAHGFLRKYDKLKSRLASRGKRQRK